MDSEPTVYEIEVVHCDRVEWLLALREAVRAELLALGLHRSVEVRVTEEPADPSRPAVVVVLGSPAASESQAVASRLDDALKRGLVVFPVVDDLTAFADQVPEGVGHLNGFEFEPARLTDLILRELEIEEKHLRVFISHKRDDGLWAAEQMHDELSHRRFQPFIDRFSIGVGRDVQREIADALEQHAFLLLLETPDAHTSEWVFDEVEYALTRTMAFLIVSWPGDVTPVPGSVGLPRLKLDASDVELGPHGASVLTKAGVDRLVAAVEREHARGLVRRRRQILRSVEDAAISAGGRATPLPGWRLYVENESGATLVGIAPRLPITEDLHQLDDARVATYEHAAALLVHAARMLTPERRALLDWATGTRNLTLAPENAVGAFWV